MRDLEGKVGFVTGGASGVGFAIARAFGKAGMRVMVADIEVPALDVAAERLRSEGIDVQGVACDVADREAVRRAAETTMAAFGKVHVVCSNAGVGCGGAIEAITPGDWDWVLGVNLMGVVHAIQAFLPLVKAQREGGHFITNVSMAGHFSTPGTAPYTAAKFGAVAVTETLAAELVGTSIGVSMLCTAFVKTRIVDSARNRSERYGLRTESSPAAEAQLTALVNSGMEPDDVADRVVNGIRNNELYILTNPEFREGVQDRFNRILTAFPTAPALEERLRAVNS